MPLLTLFSGGKKTIASLGGLAVRLQPSGMVADGSSWTNSGTSGTSLAQSNSAKRPVYNATGGPNGGPAYESNGSVDQHFTYSDLSLIRNLEAVTTITVWKTTGTACSAAFYAACAVGGNRFADHRQNDGEGDNTLTVRLRNGGADSGFDVTYGSSDKTGSTYADDTWGIDTKIVSWKRDEYRAYHNGCQLISTNIFDDSTNAEDATADTDSEAIVFLASGTSGQYDKMNGAIAEYIIFNRELSHSELKIVWDELHATYGITKNYGDEAVGIYFSGDSMMQGLKAKSRNATDVLITDGLSEKVWWYNDAYTGLWINQIEDRITGEAALSKVPRPGSIQLRDLIVLVSMGTNNVASGSQTATAAVNELEDYLDALTAEGIAVDGSGNPINRIACSQIARSDSATTTNVFGFNTEMFTEFKTLADKGLQGLADPASLPEFDNASDVTSANYDSDEIHTNDTGQPILTSRMTPQVKQLRQRKQLKDDYGAYGKAWWIAGEKTTLNSGNISDLENQFGITKYDLEQSTSGSQPALTANSRYGFPAMDFDGTNDGLAVPTEGYDLNNGAANMLIVFAIQADAAAGANDVIFMSTINGSNSTTRASILHDSNGKLVMYVRDDDYNVATLTPTTTIGTDFHIVSCLYDVAANDGGQWLDGAANGTNSAFGTVGSATFPASDNSGFIGIGRNGNGGNRFDGKIPEMLVFTDVPSGSLTTLRELCQDYLGNKYTVTIS